MIGPASLHGDRAQRFLHRLPVIDTEVGTMPRHSLRSGTRQIFVNLPDPPTMR